MWKKLSFFVFLTFVLALAVQAESDCVYHFYGEGEACPGCQESKNYIFSLTEKYSDLQVQENEVYFNLENYQLLQDYFNAYDVPEESRGIPAVFISGSYFIGDTVIKELLDNRIVDNDNNACPSLQDQVVGVTGKSYPHKVLDTLTLSILAEDSLKDSIKPAAFALLLILLLIFGLTNNSRQLLKLGISFIVGVYLAYFLNSLGLFFSFYTKNYFPKLVAVLGILVGIIILIEFFRGKKIINFENKVQKFVKPWIVFVIGLVLAMFTLPSLGDKYKVLSDLIILNYGRWTALFLTLYYLILVMLIALLIVYLCFEILNKLEHHASKKEKKEELWNKHNFGLFKFGLAIVEIVLGIVLLIL